MRLKRSGGVHGISGVANGSGRDSRAAFGRQIDLRAVAVLVAIFAVSRVVLVAVGFHFETGPLDASIQNIDPTLMRTHLLQSLWRLHGQPPLWNALVGGSLNAVPGHWPVVWHVVFLGLGLVEVLALYALLLRLGVASRIALLVAAACSVTPAAFAFENSFFYDYPTLVLATCVALAAAWFASRPSLGRGSVFFGLAASLVLLRTLFQVWWLAALIAVMLVACAGRRRTVLVSCALPLALVLGVYLKNWVMYGVPASSSWAGIGLARSAVEGLPLAERRRLVAEGKLHNVSLVKPFSPLSDYEAVGIKPDPPTGIPMLDEPEGPEFPVNMENKTFIRISRLYWKDDLWIVEHRPGAYLRAVGKGLEDFFSTATTGWAGGGNVGQMSGYDRWFDEIAYGRFGLGRTGLFFVALYVAALLVGLGTLVRRLRPGADPVTLAVVVATLTVLNVGLVGNLAEVGENYRFRFVVDPLALALVGFGLHRLRIGRRATTS